MYNHAIRITLPYVDCSGIISKWADRSSRAVVYQHDADEKVSKTHVHLILGGCETKSEALKRMWKDAPGKGNEFWSWKDWDGEMKQIVYFTKGKYTAKFVKNFSEQELEKSRQDWVEPVKADKTGDNSDYDIVKILKKYDDDMFMVKYARDHIEPTAIGTILERVRRDTFRFLYAKKRIVPHPGHYKIIASSVFMRLCERLQRENEAVDALQNLWY